MVTLQTCRIYHGGYTLHPQVCLPGVESRDGGQDKNIKSIIQHMVSLILSNLYLIMYVELSCHFFNVIYQNFKRISDCSNIVSLILSVASLYVCSHPVVLYDASTLLC